MLAVAFDCADARAVAEFWAAVFGRQIAEEHSTAQHVVLLPGEGAASGPSLVFNVVPEPKTIKNRVHLDIATSAYAAEADRLVGLGARKLGEHEGSTSRWTTFADIEGNEFDLIPQ
jgi:catechol 2,3-dioxygenase-like lactoylglutathione lyase family enzyme